MKQRNMVPRSKFFALVATIFFCLAPAMAQGESTLIWDTQGCSGPYEPWYSYDGPAGFISPSEPDFQTAWCNAGGTAHYTQADGNKYAGIGFNWSDDEDKEIDISSHSGVCVTYSVETYGGGEKVSFALISSLTPNNEYSVVLQPTEGEIRKCFAFSDFSSSSNVLIDEVLESSKGLEFKFSGTWDLGTVTLNIKKIEWPKYDEWPLTIEGTFADRVLWESEGCGDENGFRPVNGGFGYNGVWYAWVDDSQPSNQASLTPAANDNFHFNLCKSDGNVKSDARSQVIINFDLTETNVNISDKEGVCLTYSLTGANDFLRFQIVPMELTAGSSITGYNEHSASMPPTNGQVVRRCFIFASDFQQEKNQQGNVEWGNLVPLEDVLQYTKSFKLNMKNSGQQSELNIKKIEWVKTALSQGTGTEQDPYIITEAEELEFIARKVNSGDENYRGSDVYYELGSDIDLSAYANWTPIGNAYGYWSSPNWYMPDSSFKAHFDGKGHKIRNLTITGRNNITINGNSYRELGTGLFGVIMGTVQNLGLENVNITADGDGVGGIAGQIWGGSITNSYVAGGVIKTASTSTYDERRYGGIAGKVSGNINYCYSTVDVNVNISSITGGASVSAGGIAGYVFYDIAYANDDYDGTGSVKNSMALGSKVNGGAGFANRIAYGDGSLMNNIAFSEMLNKDNNAEWDNKGSTKLDGEDREAYELYEASGYLPVFANSPWTYEEGKLPGLNGEPVAMPDHINVPTDGITKVVIAPKTVDVQKGTTQSFTATVYGFGDFPETVVWSREFVSGHQTFATYDIVDGDLSVASNENVGAIVRVIATATYDGVTKRDTAIVTVVAEPVPPAIQGDTELTLKEGYEAVSTNVYSLIGTDQPITVTKISGNAKITWNDGTKTLDIAVGLTEGTYEVELEAEDTKGVTSTFTFTLTVLPLPTVTSVTVTPPTVAVQKDQSQEFTAIVAGTNGPSTEVTWSVSGNVPGTSISRGGSLYIAPEETADVLTVRATSVEDPSKFGEATVTVVEDAVPPTIEGPETYTLTVGYPATSISGYVISGTQPIIVTVTSDVNDDYYDDIITWNGATNSLQIAAGLSTGTYYATLTVSNKTLVPDALQFTLVVNPVPAVTAVAVDPSTSFLKRGDTEQFTAIVTAIGGADEEVVWSVSGNTVGTTSITEDGLLTIGALESATQLTVTATSTYNTSVKGTATVTIGTVPIIAGPATMTLDVGYEDTFSDHYTLTGTPAPTLEITAIAPETDLITWNEDESRFDIAEGLEVGIYTVAYYGKNGVGTSPSYTFVLTVVTPPTIAGPATMDDFVEGYEATSSALFTLGGTPTPTVTIATLPSTSLITWNPDTKKLDIATGLTEGTYVVTLTAESTAGTSEPHTFTLTVIRGSTPTIAVVPNANTLNARMQNGTLHISGLTAGKTWSIYTISGTLVKQSVASGTDANVNLNIPRGVYIVKSNGQIVRFVNK